MSGALGQCGVALYLVRLLAASCAWADPPLRDENDREHQAEAAANFAQFGVSMFQFVQGELHSNDPASAPTFAAQDPSSVSADLSKLRDRYVRKVEQSIHLADATQSFGTGTAALMAVGATAATGGIGLPVALAITAHKQATNWAASALKEQGRRDAATAFAFGLRKHATANSLTPAQIVAEIQSKETDDARRQFIRDIDLLKNLGNSLDEYPEARQIVEGQIIERFKDINEGLIENAGDTWSELARQSRAAQQFADQTRESLDELEKKAQALASAVTKTSERMDGLAKVQYHTAEQLNAVQELLFKNASPEDKLLLLESGGIRGLSDDQSAALKAELKAQVETRTVVTESARVVSYARQVSAILSKLDLGDERLDEAISLASTAQSAFAAVAMGDYLGGLTAVSAIFGGAQPDPVQESFNRMMGKLEAMDKKLNDILRLQQLTLQRIEDLSRQMIDFDMRVNERFDHVDFELARITDILALLNTTNLRNCNSMWHLNDPVDQQGRWHFDDVPKEQRTYSGLMEVLKTDDGGQVRACTIELQTQLDTLRSGAGVVGLPLMLRAAWEGRRVGIQGDPKEKLQLLLEQHDASIRVLLSRYPNRGRDLLFTLAAPGRVLRPKETREALRTCPDEAALCQLPDNQRWLVLTEPLIREQIPYYAAWVARAARPYDLWHKESGVNYQYYSISEIASTRRQPRAPGLYKSLLRLLDIGIAQQAVLYGELAATAVYAQAWDSATNLPRPAEGTSVDARRLLFDEELTNQWLQRNVLMIALLGSEKASHEEAVANYARTLSLLQDGDIDGIDLWMRQIFRLNDSMRFKLATLDGTDIKKLQATFPDGLAVNMPSAEEFREGRLSYPPLLPFLIRLRQLFAERLADYNALPTDPAELARVSQNLRAAFIQRPARK